MKNYIGALVGMLLAKGNSWAMGRLDEQTRKSYRHQAGSRRISSPVANESLTPLQVHRRYTETKQSPRRRGLDGTLRSNMSNRLRDIQLTGR